MKLPAEAPPWFFIALGCALLTAGCDAVSKRIMQDIDEWTTGAMVLLVSGVALLPLISCMEFGPVSLDPGRLGSDDSLGGPGVLFFSVGTAVGTTLTRLAFAGIHARAHCSDGVCHAGGTNRRLRSGRDRARDGGSLHLVQRSGEI